MNDTKNSHMPSNESSRRTTKLAKARESRRSELIAAGLDEKMVERVLDQEEFERLPIDQKVNRVVASMDHHLNVMHASLKTLAKDIVALRQNDTVISDAHDVNLRGIYLMFESLGLTADKQRAFMEQAQKWLDSEKSAQESPPEPASAKSPEPTEMERMQAEAKAIKGESRQIVTA